MCIYIYIYITISCAPYGNAAAIAMTVIDADDDLAAGVESSPMLLVINDPSMSFQKNQHVRDMDQTIKPSESVALFGSVWYSVPQLSNILMVIKLKVLCPIAIEHPDF